MSNDRSQQGVLRSGELAKAAGVSTDTLRHYERIGVLPAPRRSRNGYRAYPAEALGRVRLVRRALAMGFTLGELKRILKVRDAGGAPCREVRALAVAKLSDLEARLCEMTSVRDELRAILEEWSTRLSGTAADHRASLLESLATREPALRHPSQPLAATWRRRKKEERNVRHEK